MFRVGIRVRFRVKYCNNNTATGVRFFKEWEKRLDCLILFGSLGDKCRRSGRSVAVSSLFRCIIFRSGASEHHSMLVSWRDQGTYPHWKTHSEGDLFCLKIMDYGALISCGMWWTKHRGASPHKFCFKICEGSDNIQWIRGRQANLTLVCNLKKSSFPKTFIMDTNTFLFQCLISMQFWGFCSFTSTYPGSQGTD